MSGELRRNEDTDLELEKLEAAVEAVKKIGLPQIREMDMDKFGDMREEAKMFQMRLQELRGYL